MDRTDLLRFYVSCPPGLEPVLAGEYHALNFTRTKLKKDASSGEKSFHGEETGGMEFEGTLEEVYKANLQMRVASRVSLRMGDFIAISFAELRKKASRLEWDKYLRAGQKVSVQAVCRKSRLYHSGAVAERVLGAINDHFSSSGLLCDQSPDSQLIQVRLVNDHCIISVDSSGELLHRRGYRQAVAKAPLRENLAAGMLLSSGWDGLSPLIDPFCGSGTIPIEAALLARNIAPGIGRSFRFMDWPVFEKPLWQELMENARKNILETAPTIQGYDRDQGAIKMAKDNASRAGQWEFIHFSAQAVSSLEAPSSPGWIITNPPYGVRISENKDLRDLYAKFGSVLKDRFSGWRLGLLTNEERLSANLALGNPLKEIRLTNGGISVRFLTYEI